jgi:hypothetical protein
MSRVGLGRHGQLEDSAGDPLDGLVNLFDVGIVLAVAFLIAGMALGAKGQAEKQEKAEAQKTITRPKSKTEASGAGKSVGQVYQLSDGTLVLKTPKK